MMRHPSFTLPIADLLSYRKRFSVAVMRPAQSRVGIEHVSERRKCMTLQQSLPGSSVQQQGLLKVLCRFFASSELVHRHSDAVQDQTLMHHVAEDPKYLERSLIVQKRTRVVKPAPLQNSDRVKQVSLLCFVAESYGRVQRADEIIKRRILIVLLVSCDTRLPF